MTSSEKIRHLERVAEEYEAEGYEVISRPISSDLPASLREFRPDLLARKGTKHVIVEIKLEEPRSRALDQLGQLTAAASRVGWEVDLVVGAERQPGSWARPKRARILEQAEFLIDERMPEAALLITWAAAEPALLGLLRRYRVTLATPTPPRAAVEALQTNGIIGPTVADLLFLLATARNLAAHGSSGVPPGKRMMRRSITNIRWIDDPSFVSLDEMVEEFMSTHEDPVHSTPHDSREGGYIFMNNGAVSVQEVLEANHPSAPTEAISDAVTTIEDSGAEWKRTDL